MTFQTITGGYPTGYTLDMPTYTGLSITSTGSVGSGSVQLDMTGTVVNYGTVNASSALGNVGVYLGQGGSLSNGGGGTIYGVDGVKTPFASGSNTTVTNVGSIGGQNDGVDLFAGGQVTNGADPKKPISGTITGGFNGVYVTTGTVTNYSQINAGLGSGVEIGSGAIQNGAANDTSAVIAASNAGITALGYVTVTNDGTILFRGITGYGAEGLVLEGGGSFTNGQLGDTTALVTANQAVISQGARVYNYATIDGTGQAGFSGVELQNYANLSNGLGPDSAAALVEGYTGVSTNTGFSSIYNLGTILGLGAAGQAGVYIGGGGSVANGDLAGHGSIYGYIGVKGAGGDQVTVTNLGSIGGHQDGVALYNTGTVTNGADLASIVSGTISGGSTGVYVNNGTVTNFSLIDAGSGSGVEIGSGQMTNGATNDTGAIIAARGVGITSFNGAEVTNYATIMYHGSLGYGAGGVFLEAGGNLFNGSSDDAQALIEANTGVVANNAYVLNYGAIEGAGGFKTAGVRLQGSSRLVNGNANDPAALVSGFTGVATSSRYASVYNGGTITGLGKKNQAGVYLYGGNLTNGGGLDTTALIKGESGVIVGYGGEIQNDGVIDGVGLRYGAYGVEFTGGGYLSNGAAFTRGSLIEGYTGVIFEGGPGTMRNAGTILALGAGLDYGVTLGDGGRIQNGANYAKTALIKGDSGVSLQDGGTLANYGTVDGVYHGVRADGGVVLNGSPTDPGALIQGYIGIEGAASVTNYGTVISNAAHFYFSAGAVTDPGGVVTNGGAGDTAALLMGAFGIFMAGYGNVTNFATITGASDAGVQLAGGTVVNGAGFDTAALIRGVNGVQLTAPGAVSNFATINGLAGYGVLLEDGGAIVNGGATDRAALIEGQDGIAIDTNAGTVSNFGTILQTGVGNAVTLDDGGTVTNGSVSNSVALIEGEGGVRLAGAGAVINFATILGVGDYAGSGVVLYNGDTLTNGSAAHPGALVEGVYGVYGGAGAQITVINYGSIVGQGGPAIRFASSSDELIVEAGSVFVGQVLGDGGDLDLASGVGAMILNDVTVTVSGSMPTTVFDNFNQVEIASGASFTLTGAGANAAGQALVVDGALSVGGTLTIGGLLSDSGTLSGAGTLDLAGGTVGFGPAAVLAIAAVNQTGAGSIVIDKGGMLGISSVWTQTAGTVLAGNRISFSGVGDSFAGTLAGPGSVAFVGGTDLLEGTTLSAKNIIINGATVTLEGSIDLSDVLTATTRDLVVAAPGVTLTGGGELSVTSLASNAIVGAIAAATLTNNADKIEGSGQLGDGKMTLVNDAAGIIDADAAVALTVNTGAATIVNAGVMGATGAGGMVIESAIDNTGELKAGGGNLTVDAAVTGNGSVIVNAGTADFASAFKENVDFGATGVLELADSQAYTGRVGGFSKTGGTSLDLRDIDFIAKTRATFSGTAASGVLTVTDGTHTARIILVGDYLSSKFTVKSDGHGGTMVVDPPAGASPHAFIAAAAAMGAPHGVSQTPATAATLAHALILAIPGLTA